MLLCRQGKTATSTFQTALLPEGPSHITILAPQAQRHLQVPARSGDCSFHIWSADRPQILQQWSCADSGGSLTSQDVALKGGEVASLHPCRHQGPYSALAGTSALVAIHHNGSNDLRGPVMHIHSTLCHTMCVALPTCAGCLHMMRQLSYQSCNGLMGFGRPSMLKPSAPASELVSCAGGSDGQIYLVHLSGSHDPDSSEVHLQPAFRCSGKSQPG